MSALLMSSDSRHRRLTGPVEVQRYLARLGLASRRPRPSVDELAALQLAHLVTVPFENLDVYHRRGVSTDVASSYAKVVDAGVAGGASS